MVLISAMAFVGFAIKSIMPGLEFTGQPHHPKFLIVAQIFKWKPDT